MIAIRFEWVAVRNLRNLERVDLAPGSRFNVVSGDNGQGKTSLLEAIYMVATTRSFRTRKLKETIAHGCDVASLRASIAEADEVREQSIGIEQATRRVRVNGKRPASLAAYAVLSPVVVFHPGEMVLSSGPASARRLLLDRIGLFVDPTCLDHAARYAAAARSRQRTLEARGIHAAELAAFEHLMGVHGAALMRVRAGATEELAPELVRAFEHITAGSRGIEARFSPGGPMDAEGLACALTESRERDRHRGSASAGPHRDDLVITLGGFEARIEASQGEHRAITMALKAAELSCVSRARGVYPVLLLDDVSSELDVSRTALLFELLASTPGQIFLTTTRADMIKLPAVAPGDRRDFAIRRGVLSGP